LRISLYHAATVPTKTSRPDFGGARRIAARIENDESGRVVSASCRAARTFFAGKTLRSLGA